MDCNNCAMSIQRFLERKGLTDVLVNSQTKEVRYRQDDAALDMDGVRAGIKRLGYTVVDEPVPGEDHRGHAHELRHRHRLF